MNEQALHAKSSAPPARSSDDWQRASPDGPASTGVLVLVEGINDVEFLRRISRILHLADENIPDLNQLEHAGRLVFVPFGGGGLSYWSRRLEPVGWREFHLYDRELPPETEFHREAAKAVNARPRCHAVVTRLRALENYLHPLAIEEAQGITVTFTGMDPVASLVAQASLEPGCEWDMMSTRAQKRLCYRVKKWLNTLAVDRMTPARMAQQDPAGEVVGWLGTIAHLATARL